MWPVADGHPSVEMLMHDHRLTGQRIAPPCLFKLEDTIGEADGIVAGHRRLMLNAECPGQVFARGAYKRPAVLRCRHGKALIELSHVLLAQKAVCGLAIREPAEPQFLWQPRLPGTEAALASAPRLR